MYTAEWAWRSASRGFVCLGVKPEDTSNVFLLFMFGFLFLNVTFTVTVSIAAVNVPSL